MSSRSLVSTAFPVLAWVAVLAAVWAFPSVISVYGALWVLLPCLLAYIGFRSGTGHRDMRAGAAAVLASGACEALTAAAIGAALNAFRGWNIYFPLFDYLVIGLAASSVGLLFSLLAHRVRAR